MEIQIKARVEQDPLMGEVGERSQNWKSLTIESHLGLAIMPDKSRKEARHVTSLFCLCARQGALTRE